VWVERTPAEFLFDVKAFRLFTQHQTPVTSLPGDIRQEPSAETQDKGTVYQRDLFPEVVTEVWNRFESALLPLDSAGKLGVVLFQLPPWFYPVKNQLEYILACRDRQSQYTIAVEYRHNSWLNEKNRERTLKFLRDNDLPLVCVDESQGFSSSVPPVAEAMFDIALVRFHGRNKETWEKKGISPAECFNYSYGQEELAEWVPRVRELASRARQVHVLFNNCHQDKAVVNARQIAIMLD
jgi:uncharacterized protein YecE (DUF72 family)